MTLRPRWAAYLASAALLGLAVVVAGQGGCDIDPTLGIRAQGALWSGFSASISNSNTSAVSNAFIPPAVQGQNASSARACNCRCAATPSCVAYTWLGAELQQCWLHSSVQFDQQPVTSVGTQAAAADAVVGRVVRNETGSPVCALVRDTRGVFNTSNSAGIANPLRTSLNHNECNQACRQEPACIAWSWSAATATDAKGNCTLYSSVTGMTPQATGNNYVAVLQACQELLAPPPSPPNPPPPFPPAPPAPPASVGYCQINAAKGFRYQGVVWRGWVPLQGSGTLGYTSFVQRDIPNNKQNQTAATPGDCNCICNEVEACVGYVWLGGNLKQCWLQSYVEFFTAQLRDWYHTTEDVLGQIRVPKDTVIARRIDNGTWPLCSNLFEYPIGFKAFGNMKIRSTISGLANQFECNQACGNDDYCVGFTFAAPLYNVTFTNQTEFDVQTSDCHLWSETVDLGGSDPLAFGQKQTWSSPLQTCLETAPLTDGSQVNAGYPPPAPPLPPQADLAAPPATSCTMDATPGVRYQGVIWDSWLPIRNWGDAGDARTWKIGETTFLDPASNKFIPDELQGKQVNSFQECNCRCANLTTCIGYTWLGGDYKQCWLHSWVNYMANTVTYMPQSLADGGGYTLVPPDTVLGRVVKFAPSQELFDSNSWQPLPCNLTLFNTGVQPTKLDSSLIRYNPVVPLYGADCNQYCLFDPHCVAYSWMALNPDDQSMCTLYSSASGDPQLVTFPDTIFFFGSLQVCPELRVGPPAPPFPPSPPPLPPAPPRSPPAPATLGSCSVDPSAGIRYTGKVWPNWTPVMGFGGSGLLSQQYATNANIPDDKQGLPADSAAECNCRCDGVPLCIGYTWLGTQRKECWLHSYVQFYVDPVDSFFDPLSSNMDPTPVPADAVIARLVPTSSRSAGYRGCGLDLYPDAAIKTSGTAGITQSPDRMPPLVCAQLCFQNPSCVAFSWQGVSNSVNELVVCTLLSQASGGFTAVAASPDGTHTNFAVVQSCQTLRNQGLTTATSQPPPPPALPAPPAVSTQCPTNISTAIRYTGVVWPGWWPRYRAGWVKEQGAAANVTSWSNNYIPDDVQGLTATTPEDCNCRCMNTTACVGYTWLGGDKKQCWMHSWVQWYDNPVTTYADVPSGAAVPVPADTVLARVMTTADWPFCDNIGKYYPKMAVATASSQGISVPNPTAASWQACNQACGRDPACVAFTWRGALDPASDPSKTGINCQLLSSASGGLVFNSSSNGVRYTSPLQLCTDTFGDLQGTPPDQGIKESSSSSSSSSSKLSTGALVGIIVGAVCGGALVAALVAFFVIRRRRATNSTFGFSVPGSKSMAPSTAGGSIWSLGQTNQTDRHTPMAVPGLAKGEIFTRATAYEYSWLTTPMDPMAAVAVEAGINDTELDTMFKSMSGSELPPVVELSKDDLRQQVQLVQNGLLGRGATALVFQCVWPSRFGPNSLLAIKVLKDGHEVDPLVLQSFAYEANVLATTEHPCVIRLYGYCLEPPTVCLILELLPYSLKDLLYGVQAHPDSTTRRPLHPSQLTSSLPLLTGSDLTPRTYSSGADTQHTVKTTTPLMVVVTPEDEPFDPSNSTGAPSPDNGAPTSASPPTSPPPTAPTPGSSSSTPDLRLDVVSLNEPKRNKPYQLTMQSAPDYMSSTGTGTNMSGLVLPSPGCKPPPLSMLQVLRISAEIAAGLAYLHDRPVYNTTGHKSHAVLTLEPNGGANTTTLNSQGMKIVHRDLKPANILINSRGRAKISDFGLARKTQRTTVHTERLGAGTLPYMAPELLAGATSGNAYKLAPTNRVDIYSLAMMMWEMISGQQPWSDKNEVAIMSAVIRNQRPELPNLPKPKVEDAGKQDLEHLPASLISLAEFNSIVKACWSQRELKRPTAAAVFNMLCNVMRTYGATPPEDLKVAVASPIPSTPDTPDDTA